MSGSQQGEGGWLPIESAPKDGTRVLCWEDGHDMYVGCWDDFVPRGSLEPVGWVDGQAYKQEPEMWQPLPAPPANPQEKK